MSGRILIIDTVATNRIVLKVKMLSAQFSVDACSSQIEAEAIIATNRPDLILINLSDPVESRHEFCRSLKADYATSGIAIIAIGVADTAKARFAALDAGADDVLPRPMHDTLLLARIRSLLRARGAGQELSLHDGTRRALGFEEQQATFAAATHVALVTPDEEQNAMLADMLRAGFGPSIRHLSQKAALKAVGERPQPDLFVVDCTQIDVYQNDLFRLVSDLRSRNETRRSTQLIMVPPGEQDIAAMFLDLGADDTVIGAVSQGELTLRAKALIRQKQGQDRLRDRVHNGLEAAVTDPLTGLYNRRYVAAHLARMAEQSSRAGRELAIMMLDLDHFKTINDRHGHAAGDQVLVQVADRLRENMRAIDMVARVGGEEFLIAMPRTTWTQAQAAADRLRLIVNERRFGIGEGGPELRVTASIGVATTGGLQMGEFDFDRMCERADAALYAAKSAGRNQVAMSRSAA